MKTAEKAEAAGPRRRARSGGPACLERLAREGLAGAIPLIVNKLVEKAMQGSVAHLKLLMDLAGLMARGAKGGKRGKSVAQTLLDEWQARGAVGTWSVVPADADVGGGDDG